ncbi:MAG TPA: SusC/RagA family TonB-linked outer membrane protein [Chryseolinea sp.]|nr:SusC/RagA family TonB-linked outer membrane protein [Chryseolinea sp.]
MAGSLQLLMASTASSQGLGDITVTIEMNNERLTTLFSKIEKQTGLSFGFRPELVEQHTSVSIPGATRSVKETLDLALKGKSIVYERAGNVILIREQKKKGSDIQPNIDNQKANERTWEKPATFYMITGRITDTNGTPMAGVNIIVKGTTNGTSSDAEGGYAINGEETDILVFSFIGYKTVEAAVSGRTGIDAVMQEDASTLNEVVINGGYYTTTEKTTTGNISRVSGEEIAKQPVTNVMQALQGRMPGVEIIQQSGVPGTGMKILIRGQNSLRNSSTENGNLPLYVIDGVPVNSSPLPSEGFLTRNAGIDPLNTINPNNIESIEILKDASATAIYGSRGANGVVLITTKKGASGRTGLELNFYRGVGKASTRMDLLNTQQYLTMRREALRNDQDAPMSWRDGDLLQWDTTRYTDWQRELFGGTANITNGQIDISGGTRNTNFRFGGAFHKETLVFPGDFGYQKFTGHLGLNHRSTDERFEAVNSISFGADRNTFFNADLVYHALHLAPVAPAIYASDGSLNWENNSWNNPMAELQRVQDNTSQSLIVNSVLSYRVLHALTVKANLGYSNFVFDELRKTPKDSYSPSIREDVFDAADVIRGGNRSWIIEPQATYSKTIGEGALDILVGTTWQEVYRDNLAISAASYASPSQIGNLQAAALTQIMNDERTTYRYNAVFARIGYSWQEKYFVNLTGRRDGSSRFGSENRFANFGALGAAWIFSNEEFLKGRLGPISYGKLRASVGTTGNDQIGDYRYFDTYSPTEGTYQGYKGLYPTQLANPRYAWELNTKHEAALDLGFAKDRIRFGASWYLNRSGNQLVGYPLPLITGFSTVQANLDATVQNTGWEFQVSSINIQKPLISWRSSVNLTIPRTKLVSYPGLETSSYASSLIVGKPLNIYQVYEFTDVDPATGLYRVVDADNDGVMGLADRKIVRNMGRQYYGGLSNTILFKSIELDFLLEFVKQDASLNMLNFATPGFAAANQPTDVMSRWQREGDISRTAKFTQSYADWENIFNGSLSDVNIGDASFIRLKTLALSYRLPAPRAQSVHLVGCRFFLQAQNVLTFSRYPGLDPQSPGMALPALAVYTLGAQVQF